MKKKDTIYNENLDHFIVLKKYEKFCKCCGGIGIYVINNISRVKCPICEGKGKIDYIEELKGLPSERALEFWRRCGPL